MALGEILASAGTAILNGLLSDNSGSTSNVTDGIDIQDTAQMDVGDVLNTQGTELSKQDETPTEEGSLEAEEFINPQLSEFLTEHNYIPEDKNIEQEWSLDNSLGDSNYNYTSENNNVDDIQTEEQAPIEVDMNSDNNYTTPTTYSSPVDNEPNTLESKDTDVHLSTMNGPSGVMPSIPEVPHQEENNNIGQDIKEQDSYLTKDEIKDVVGTEPTDEQVKQVNENFHEENGNVVLDTDATAEGINSISDNNSNFTDDKVNEALDSQTATDDKQMLIDAFLTKEGYATEEEVHNRAKELGVDDYQVRNGISQDGGQNFWYAEKPSVGAVAAVAEPTDDITNDIHSENAVENIDENGDDVFAALAKEAELEKRLKDQNGREDMEFDKNFFGTTVFNTEQDLVKALGKEGITNPKDFEVLIGKDDNGYFYFAIPTYKKELLDEAIEKSKATLASEMSTDELGRLLKERHRLEREEKERNKVENWHYEDLKEFINKGYGGFHHKKELALRDFINRIGIRDPEIVKGLRKELSQSGKWSDLKQRYPELRGRTKTVDTYEKRLEVAYRHLYQQKGNEKNVEPVELKKNKTYSVGELKNITQQNVPQDSDISYVRYYRPVFTNAEAEEAVNTFLTKYPTYEKAWDNFVQTGEGFNILEKPFSNEGISLRKVRDSIQLVEDTYILNADNLTNKEKSEIKNVNEKNAETISTENIDAVEGELKEGNYVVADTTTEDDIDNGEVTLENTKTGETITAVFDDTVDREALKDEVYNIRNISAETQEEKEEKATKKAVGKHLKNWFKRVWSVSSGGKGVDAAPSGSSGNLSVGAAENGTKLSRETTDKVGGNAKGGSSEHLSGANNSSRGLTSFTAGKDNVETKQNESANQTVKGASKGNVVDSNSKENVSSYKLPSRTTATTNAKKQLKEKDTKHNRQLTKETSPKLKGTKYSKSKQMFTASVHNNVIMATVVDKLTEAVIKRYHSWTRSGVYFYFNGDNGKIRYKVGGTIEVRLKGETNWQSLRTMAKVGGSQKELEELYNEVMKF